MPGSYALGAHPPAVNKKGFCLVLALSPKDRIGNEVYELVVASVARPLSLVVC
jgi:hypothetical protein